MKFTIIENINNIKEIWSAGFISPIHKDLSIDEYDFDIFDQWKFSENYTSPEEIEGLIDDIFNYNKQKLSKDEIISRLLNGEVFTDGDCFISLNQETVDKALNDYYEERYNEKLEKYGYPRDPDDYRDDMD